MKLRNAVLYVKDIEKSKEHAQVKVSVIVILMRINQVYLFRRKDTGWADGDYTVPSGHVDEGETPIEAAIREANEEVGVKIKKEDLKLVHSDYIKGQVINFTFIADKWEGEANVMEADKAEDGEWFSIDDLPENIAGHGSTILKNINKNIIYHEIK